jgi:hypothetical protein
MKKVSWLQWLPWRGWRIVLAVEAADEIPERLPSKGAVLVGTLERPKWLAFDCPCKSGHRIMVTLDSGHRPHWKLLGQKKLSVMPSIDYCAPGRRCHYFIKDGKTVWAKDGGSRVGSR